MGGLSHQPAHESMVVTDKSRMTIISGAVDSIHQAEARLERTANRLAKQTDSTEQAPDVVSLSDEVVALLEARNAVAANVSVLHAADDIQKSLLNLLA
jgi:flagellar hook-associated protein FlgK